MVTRRTALAVTVTFTTLAAAGLALHAGCRGPGASPAAVELAGAGLGSATPQASPPAASTAASGAERLDAVRVVKLFCDLVESGRLWRARGLCSTPAAWRRRQLRAVTRFSFLSARIVDASDPGALTVLVRIHVHTRRDRPPEHTTLHEGVNTLFFTLGRVGTTSGGWLISAVKTSP
jgi:hypothetical protein